MQIGKIETVFNQSVLVLASGIFVHYNFLFTTSLQLFFTTYFTTFFFVHYNSDKWFRISILDQFFLCFSGVMLIL